MEDITPKYPIIPAKEKIISEMDGVTEKVGGLGGRLASTVAEAINKDGNLVNDIINARLDSEAQSILAGFTFGAADYAGAVKAGDITWNTSTGAITGGSGIILYRLGIVGAAAGITTFSINATTGAATFAGTLSAPLGNIGGFTIGASDLTAVAGGNTTIVSSGATAFTAGPTGSPTTTITQAGLATFADISVTGGSVATSTLSGLVALSNVNVAAQGWTQTSAFSSTDLNTVSWGAGTLTTAAGTAYSIGAGNTGNMAARTYIYLDIAVSTTAYQTTTTAATAVGSGKILVATAINGAAEAEFQVFGGLGGFHVLATDAIVANSVTAALMNVSQLSAISADIGSITAGSITVVSGGNTVSLTPGSATAFAAGPTGSPNCTITQAGVLTATGAVIDGYTVTQQGTFGGDGSDGELTITSGTTTIDLDSLEVVVKNYTSISITGTGKIAFSNPHANGTIVILKSQDSVVLTSSTVPCIEFSGLGSSVGNNGTSILDSTAHYGDTGAGGIGGSGGVAYDAATRTFYTFNKTQLVRRSIFVACGSAGGSGQSYTVGNVGGGGGGGSFSFSGGAGGTGGTNGSNAGGAGAGGGGGGQDGANAVGAGGGGGASGFGGILYKTATATSGTIDNAGGAGGEAAVGGTGTTTGGTGGRGGGGWTIECAGDLNFTGTIYSRGIVGGNCGAGGGTSGGSSGASIGGFIEKNVYFA